MVILLGLLIFVHELGHFLVAKYFKVRVEVFSLGFGKKLLSFRRGETEYCVSAIPLGGYVKMFGEDPTASVSEADRLGSYLHKPVAQRIAIVLAGPLMNLFFAWLLYSAISLSGEKVIAPRLGDIQANTKAFAAGFRSGDLIESVNKSLVTTYAEFEKTLATSAGQNLEVSVVRNDGTAEQFTVTPELGANPNVLAWQREIGRIEGLTVSSRAALVAVKQSSLDFKSAAYDAGLRSGDAILELNGVSTTKWRELVSRIGTFLQADQPEQTIKVRVQRGLMESLVNEGDSTPRTLDFEVPIPTQARGTSGEEGLEALGFVDSELFISHVEKKSPAEGAGLRPGDQILQINDLQLRSFEEVMTAIRSYDETSGTPLSIRVRRPSGQEDQLEIKPNVRTRMTPKGTEETRYEIGIRPLLIDDNYETVTVSASNLADAAIKGLNRSFEVSAAVFTGLIRLFQGEVSSKNVGGFLSIGQIAKKSWSMGFTEFFLQMALISINLFIINLLPLPVLDGGHLVFYTLEAVRGAPLSVQKMELAQRVGAALLISLMVFALFNDVTRIFMR